MSEMSKIDSSELYRKIARHIPDWPSNPPQYYAECNDLYSFLGMKRSVLSARLINEWHPTKNGSLTPDGIAPFSSRRIWWKCKKGHEWEEAAASRSKGRGACPYCISLAIRNPKLAKEWHPTKNDELTPKDRTLYSSKRVWWKCKKGHEWKAIISRRATGYSCPVCSSLATVNPKLVKEWHPTKNGKLTARDVLRRSAKRVWWKCVKGHEWETSVTSRSNGASCPYCASKKASKENCLATIHPKLAKEWHPTKNGSLTARDVTRRSRKKVWWKCKEGHEWEATVDNRTVCSNCPSCSTRRGRRVHEGNCLATLNPKLAKEWHPTKNGELTATDISFGCGDKVWWKCEKGHEWKARVCNRSQGHGCPVCFGRMKVA